MHHNGATSPLVMLSSLVISSGLTVLMFAQDSADRLLTLLPQWVVLVTWGISIIVSIGTAAASIYKKIQEGKAAAIYAERQICDVEKCAYRRLLEKDLRQKDDD